MRQRENRIESRGFERRINSRSHADNSGDDHRQQDVEDRDGHRDRSERRDQRRNSPRDEKSEQTAQQVDLSRNRGVMNYALFAYASLFESVDPNQSKAAAEVKLRDERRRTMTEFMK